MSEKEIIDKSTEIVEDTLRNTLDLIKKLQQELQAEKEKNKDIKAIGRNNNPPPIIHFAPSGLEYELVYIKKGKTAKDFISKDKIKEKIEEKLNYYMSYKGLEIFKKDNFKEILLVLEQLKQELLEE